MNRRVFTNEELKEHWEYFPEAIFLSIDNPNYIVKLKDGRVSIGIHVSVDSITLDYDDYKKLENWILLEPSTALLTNQVVGLKSDFVIQHKYLTSKYGWRHEDKMMTPDQFASMVMAVRYPVEQLSDILTNALWYRVPTLDEILPQD